MGSASLADLVNGSYKLERGELTNDDGKTIEGQAVTPGQRRTTSQTNEINLLACQRAPDFKS